MIALFFLNGIMDLKNGCLINNQITIDSKNKKIFDVLKIGTSFRILRKAEIAENLVKVT